VTLSCGGRRRKTHATPQTIRFDVLSSRIATFAIPSRCDPGYGPRRPSRLPGVVGSAVSSVAEVDVVVVKVELVLGQNPTLLVRTVEPPRPGLRADDLIRPALWREVREHPAYPQYVGVLAVALHGFPVHVPDVGCPAVVVGVGQPAGLPITLRYARPVLDTRDKVVAFLEGVDADPVLSRYGSQSPNETRVHHPGTQVTRRLTRRPKVRVIQKLLHIAGAPGLVSSEEARIPDAPSAAEGAGWIEALSVRTAETFTGDDEDHQHAERRYRRQDRDSPDQPKSPFALTFVFYDGPQWGSVRHVPYHVPYNPHGKLQDMGVP